MGPPAAGPPPDRRFEPSDRIKRSDDFTEILRRGAFAADDLLVVNVRWRPPSRPPDHAADHPSAGHPSTDQPAGQVPAESTAVQLATPPPGREGPRRPQAVAVEESRLGITIPKKTGSAVLRNRWKRWIREAFRLQRERIPGGLDIIVRPKRGAVGSFAAIARSLPNTVRRAQRRLEQSS